MEYTPTYDNYAKMLQDIKATGKLKDFYSYEGYDNFIIIRHDIEFDIMKALDMAEIEADMGVYTTYLVQIGSEAYNAFSDDNIRRLIRIMNLGHYVGLHYRQENSSYNYGCADIDRQLDMLQKRLPFASRIVACHRPIKDSPYNEYIGRFRNCYSEPFFYKTDEPETAPTRYISDSKWRWNYGEPTSETFETVPRLQLVIHPFQWSAFGFSMKDTFSRIAKQKSIALLDTFRNEYERYAEIDGK